MNYLQRFSRALAALADKNAHERALRRLRRQARMEDGDWLGQLHLVARRLPPRQRAVRDRPPG